MSKNYDPEELAKFADLAAQWWDVEGQLKTLHQLNPLRLNYISSKLIDSIPTSHTPDLKDKKIIDVGCGGGILSEALSKCGASVTGIDLNKSLIDVARIHQLESGTQVEYIHTSVEKIAAEQPASYDVVTCLELLEHVPDPQAIVSACSALVKPGGHVFYSTINRNPKSYLFAILGAEYFLKLLPKNTHDYAKFIRPSELSSWIRCSNLHVQEIKGVTYHPFTNLFTLTNDISVNYLLHAMKS